jgi:hypothetical protein
MSYREIVLAVIEAIGGDKDFWDKAQTCEQALERAEDVLRRHVPPMRYRVQVHEGGHRIPVGLVDNFFDAKRLALSHVDDALPHNTVHVLDDGKEVGQAYFAGDGSAAWRDR